jgi:hypothetical protein
MNTPNPSGTVADATKGNWLDRYAPEPVKPYGRLARWDRPIGFYLLFWPCAWGIGLAAVAQPAFGFGWWAAILMFIGAILMRGAGCTFNDIVDRDIDMKVARTRSRPIPSGQVTARDATYFMVAQALLASAVLFQFNRFTVWAAIASLVLVAIYPFMKRVTWWPQLFLGLAFSYGALVGWSSQTGGLGWAPVVLYLGTILWVIGYDTIYALQDIGTTPWSASNPPPACSAPMSGRPWRRSMPVPSCSGTLPASWPAAACYLRCSRWWRQGCSPGSSGPSTQSCRATLSYDSTTTTMWAWRSRSRFWPNGSGSANSLLANWPKSERADRTTGRPFQLALEGRN